MPYSSIKELPTQVSSLPQNAKKIFMAAFNNAYKQYDNEETAFKVAWAAVKTQFTKNLKGNWVKKSFYTPEYHVLLSGMYIVKAMIKNGEMTWQATASDTGLDSYEERMSVDLYRNFIEKLDGHEYLSLAHYPSLDGKAEFGKVQNLYIDGEMLKARGIFSNDPKGVAAYNAIRKDRRDNLPQDQRIRISIGFWDLAHEHGNLGGWNYKSGKPCEFCARGIKDKSYINGKLDHLALTRIPARKTTSIEVE